MESNLPSDTAEASAEFSTSPVDASRQSPFTILIVEDDAALRLLLRLTLTNEPYTIYEAATGETALAMALDLNPDLILLDIALPDTDGIRVLQQIRQANSTVPILMVSALNMQKWVFAAMTNGADGFLAKPLNVTTLRRTVAKHLTSSQSHWRHVNLA